MATAGRWVLWILIGLVAVFSGLLVLALMVLLYLQIPQNAAGMAAKAVCSAHFVAGRQEPPEVLLAEDVAPASPAFSVISASVDEQQRTVTARFLGIITREASLLDQRGCVLDAPAQPDAVPFQPSAPAPGPWPAGDQPVAPAELASEVDMAALDRVLDSALEGAGDPTLANTRGLAVVQGGRLLAVRESPVLPAGTPLHGWSMTKTVAAILVYTRAAEVGLDLQTPVVDAFRPGREPSWVADWRTDERARITVADLLYMRDGLENDEGYDAVGSVVQMLYGEPDMAAWAADHPAAHPAGTTWQYLSATANILAEVARGQFDTDEEYWAYSRTALFDRIGVTSATLETDTVGTWVGSSFLWADTLDWARLGLLMLQDGRWGDEQVLPAGWLAVATEPAVPTGEGHGYGAQTWLVGQPVDGECAAYPGVPEDTIAMEGHWGQLVAMVPSRDAVIVRLGWTFDSDQFDGCALVSDVLATLP